MGRSFYKLPGRFFEPFHLWLSHMHCAKKHHATKKLWIYSHSLLVLQVSTTTKLFPKKILFFPECCQKNSRRVGRVIWRCRLYMCCSMFIGIKIVVLHFYFVGKKKSLKFNLKVVWKTLICFRTLFHTFFIYLLEYYNETREQHSCSFYFVI